MIDHNYIFNKDELCYCLLSSYNHPNILIPIKCLITDIKFGQDVVDYQVRIEHFYDEINFLKAYLYNMLFYTKFDNAHKVKLTIPVFNGIDEINKYLDTAIVTVIVPHLMCFSSKAEMMDVFNKLNYYFISLHTYNLKLALTRSSYKGEFKLDGSKDFNNRFTNFIGDKVDEKTLKVFLEDIDRTKSIFSETYKVNRKKYNRKYLKKPVE